MKEECPFLILWTGCESNLSGDCKIGGYCRHEWRTKQEKCYELRNRTSNMNNIDKIVLLHWYKSKE